MTAPFYEDQHATVWHGDCVAVLAGFPDNHFDAVITDPPYAISFMSRSWDGWDTPRGFQAWCVTWAAECLRVLKPGGALLAFGGTRTWHRLVCAIEDAGFEVRDSVAYLFGSGFPKSLDVSKAIDKRPGVSRHAEFAVALRAAMAEKGYTNTFDVAEAVIGRRTGAVANWQKYQFPEAKWWPALRDLLDMDDDEWGPVIAEAERERVGTRAGNKLAVAPGQGMDRSGIDLDVTEPATAEAQRWAGYGTSLKPGHEPVVCARKPFNAVSLDWRMLATVHHALAGLLWLSLSSAKRAELASLSNQAERSGPQPCVSALVSAAMDTSPDGYDKTATFNSPETALTSWSIASSWSSFLAALSDSTTTSTTSTASSTTTVLRILNSLLAPVTSPSTMPACGCLLAGASEPAANAASSSSGEWPSWLRTLNASVPESATEGLAAVVASALAAAVESSSNGQAVGSSARSTATTSTAPGHEPVCVARKPLDGTVAGNVLRWGTGGVNIDAMRIDVGQSDPLRTATYVGSNPGTAGHTMGDGWTNQGQNVPMWSGAGRWPANVVLDEVTAAALDQTTGDRPSSGVYDGDGSRRPGEWATDFAGGHRPATMYGDTGGPSRFFFVSTSKGSIIEPCVTANTAEGNSSPPSELGGSAPSGAATSGSHEDNSKRPAKAPSTSGTATGSRPSGDNDTPPIPNTDVRFSPESRPLRHTPTSSPANDAEPAEPTDTTMTTTSHSTSGGSADPATFSTTPSSKEPGAPVSPIEPPSESLPFMYTAKAPADERITIDGVSHVTVKPLDLMRWLVRGYAGPKGALILDPFAGSGTTGEAAIAEGMRVVLIEQGETYLPLIKARVTRRTDPVEHLRTVGEDLGLFGLDE